MVVASRSRVGGYPMQSRITKEEEMLRLIKDFKRDNQGVTMIEYALIAGLISVVAIALISSVGGKVKNLFTTVNNALTTA